MKNYIIMNASVYEGTRATDGQKYHWVQGELFNYENPQENPNRLPIMVITRETESIKFWKCSVPVPTEKADGRKRNGFVVADFNYKAAVKAMQEKKFADGTPCLLQLPSFDPTTGQMTIVEKNDMFFLKNNVDLVLIPLTGNWARVATRPTTVIVNGVQKTIGIGEFIPGPTGTIPIVTSIRIAMQRGSDGEFIEDLEEQKNRILERHYRQIGEIPTNAPGTQIQQNAPDPQEEAAKKEQEAAAAAAALGMTIQQP